VQTQRAIENFRITGTKMGDYPAFVKAIDPAFELVTTEENGIRLYTIKKK